MTQEPILCQWCGEEMEILTNLPPNEKIYLCPECYDKFIDFLHTKELIEYDAEEDEFDGECKFDWVGVREG